MPVESWYQSTKMQKTISKIEMNSFVEDCFEKISIKELILTETQYLTIVKE